MIDTCKICVIIVGKTLDDFLSQLKKAQLTADFVELRLDYLENIDPETVRTIKNHTYKKAIFCCRSRSEGGYFRGTFEDQQEILQAGNTLGFDYLDIDFPIAHKIRIQEKKTKTIISYHNFLYTPSLMVLNRLLENMRPFKPDVFKFAVKIVQSKDVKILFQLLINKRSYENMIVVGMGEQGKIIRLISPLLGGYLTFAAINETISAPGQLNLNIIQDFYRLFYKVVQYDSRQFNGDFDV